MSTADHEGHDATQPRDGDAAAYVRSLAHHGRLAKRAGDASAEESALLRRGAYQIVWPVVFDGLTRGIERQRGHRRCVIGIEYLEPECLDRFQDDVEAVVDDLLRYGTVPIRNVEGWVRSRLVRATIDGNRRRRGERGALQRPRLPRWLERRIGEDRWLRALALDVLVWVGVPTTAGAGLWPYAAWADRRVAITGDMATTERDVERDVEKVLTIMRTNVPWYEQYIERPLGRKQAPLAQFGPEAVQEPAHLALTERHEADDALLRELAALAIDAMTVRFERGEDRRSVVVDVIETVFGGDGSPMYRDPGTNPVDDQLGALLSDHQAIDQLVHQICQILGVPDE